MPARIAPPMQRRIIELYESGTRISAIATELALSRGTVSKYVKHHAGNAGYLVPEDEALTRGEIRELRYVIAALGYIRCAGCRRHMPTLSTQAIVTCHSCGKETHRTLPSRSALASLPPL